MRLFDLRSLAVAAAVLLGLGAPEASRAATIDADIMFVVDGSGSMGDDFVTLGANLSTFINGLRADPRIGSIRIGLVRYSLNPIVQIAMTDDLTAFNGLRRGTGNSSVENPLKAIDFAVTNPAIVYRPDAVRTIVLITDEEGDDFGSYTNAFGRGGAALGAMLDDLGFLNNILHNPRKRGSFENYSTIARPFGALFDIGDFRNNPAAFLQSFAEVKVREFVEFHALTNPPAVVPLPAGGWLLLAGLGGFAVLRRRRAPAA